MWFLNNQIGELVNINNTFMVHWPQVPGTCSGQFMVHIVVHCPIYVRFSVGVYCGNVWVWKLLMAWASCYSSKVRKLTLSNTCQYSYYMFHFTCQNPFLNSREIWECIKELPMDCQGGGVEVSSDKLGQFALLYKDRDLEI